MPLDYSVWPVSNEEVNPGTPGPGPGAKHVMKVINSLGHKDKCALIDATDIISSREYECTVYGVL